MVPFELPPRKPVTRMPSPTSFRIAACGLGPSVQERLLIPPEVGAISSFFP